MTTQQFLYTVFAIDSPLAFYAVSILAYFRWVWR